jgi:hypothetical protein
MQHVNLLEIWPLLAERSPHMPFCHLRGSIGRLRIDDTLHIDHRWRYLNILQW